MKKQTFITVAALTLLVSCQGNKSGQASEGKDSTNVDSQEKKLRIPLHINDDFNQITSLGGVNIIYTQGDFNIEVEGDSSLLNYVQADAESGILTISLAGERNQDLNCYEGKSDINAYISCPDLKCVALCSSGNFTSHGMWKTQVLQLGIIGSGSFDVDSISCTSMDYQTTGKGNATFKNITATDAINIACMSKSDVTADVNTNHLSVATQAGKVTLSGTAKQKDISATNSRLIKDSTK